MRIMGIGIIRYYRVLHGWVNYEFGIITVLTDYWLDGIIKKIGNKRGHTYEDTLTQHAYEELIEHHTRLNNTRMYNHTPSQI